MAINELARDIPGKVPAITSIDPSHQALSNQQLINPSKADVQTPSGGGSSLSANYGEDITEKNMGQGNRGSGNIINNLQGSPSYEGLEGNPEWVNQLSIANKVASAAGLFSKGYDTSMGEGTSDLTKGLGYGSNITSGLLTAYSGYKAITGTADEKKQAYMGLGSQALQYGLGKYAATEAASAASMSALSGGGADVVAGSVAPSFLSGVAGSVAGYAMPYYALAKTGGAISDSIVANNPKLGGTGFFTWGSSHREPLAVEQYWGKELASHGVGNPEFNEAWATQNPLEVGGWIQDTTDKALNAATGGIYGIGQMYEAGSSDVKAGMDIASQGLTSLAGVGKSTESTVNAGLNIATGGLEGLGKKVFGTVICTELNRQGFISKEVWKESSKYGKNMDNGSYQWYISWGIPLVKMMKESRILSFIVNLLLRPMFIHIAGEAGVGRGSLFGKIVLRTLELVYKLKCYKEELYGYNASINR